MAHTPGPWKPGREDTQSYDGLTGEPFSSVYADDKRGGVHMGERLALVIARIPGDKIERDEEKANARLIAAAPEMKAALEQIAKGEGAFSRDPLTHATNVIEEAKAIARAALAKATA